MASNNPDHPGHMRLASAGIGVIIFTVSQILHAYAAFSPYMMWREDQSPRNAIAIPIAIIEAIISLWAIKTSISSYAERTALSLLGGCLGLGSCLVGIVLGNMNDWIQAIWLLFFVFWSSFALEFCLGILNWLTNWALSDGPRHLIFRTRQAMRMGPPQGTGGSATGDSYTFTAIPGSSSKHGSPTLVGSPRHSVSSQHEIVINRR